MSLKNEIEDVSQKLPFRASNGRRALVDMNYVVVHHDAHLTQDTYDAVARYIEQANYHISKGWNHISYHLRIARDGKIRKVLPFNEIGYHAGNWKYNKTGIGVCLDGDFSKQEPTKDQLISLERVLAYFDHETPEMPALTHRGFFAHGEVRLSPTFCPSPKIRAIVEAARKRS